MAESDIAICNRALDMCDADAILSFDDQTKNAQRLKRSFVPVRRAVIRAYPWNCVTRRAALAASAEAPAWGFARQFALPEGPSPARCLNVRSVEGEIEGTASPYKIEGRFIVSDDAAPLNILYLADITDPTRYDPLLDDAIAYRLAAELCYPLTGSRTAAADMRTAYRDVLKEARRVDAQEGTPEEILASLWTDSRL